MNDEERTRMFKKVFAPKSGEKVLFLIDLPHGKISDNSKWKSRRIMANDWFRAFKDMGETVGFSVDFLEYNATGMNNSPIPKEVITEARKANLVIAMNEFSATSSLGQICISPGTITRCASMPGVEKRMEETAFKADYSQVQRYATSIEKMLNKAVGASVSFSTDDYLYIDLRNRVAHSDDGDCTKTGQVINFPSGEACKVPYEAATDEINEFGESKTEGILPYYFNNEIIKFIIKNNTIVDIKGDGGKTRELREFFNENKTRRNIAELGIGCNPNAVVTGNILEDEKVGLHIAYGMSSHLGGKIESDMHQDICYPKGLPIEGTTLTLIDGNGLKTELIQNAMLRYELFE